MKQMLPGALLEKNKTTLRELRDAFIHWEKNYGPYVTVEFVPEELQDSDRVWTAWLNEGIPNENDVSYITNGYDPGSGIRFYIASKPFDPNVGIYEVTTEIWFTCPECDGDPDSCETREGEGKIRVGLDEEIYGL